MNEYPLAEYRTRLEVHGVGRASSRVYRLFGL